MKKITYAILSFTLVFGLVACSNSSNEGNGQQTPSNQTGSSGDIGTNSGVETGTAGTGGTKSPDLDAKATVVFSTFWPDDRFKEAKKKYEALHPNIEIKLQNVETDNSHLEAELEKYTTATNTAMLAGKGPDMLELDLLPTDSYVKHDLLADMGEMMDQDSTFKKEDYFSNILDGARVGKGLYAMPLSFFLMGFTGDEKAIANSGVKVNDKTWTWNDFAQTAKDLAKTDGNTAAFSYPANYMLSEMVKDNYPLFIDKANGKANFESASFSGLMQQVKGMVDDGVIVEGGRNSYFQSTQINSPWDYLVSLRENGENTKLFTKPHAQDTAEGGYFRSYRTIGLNANSKVKNQAWDFIKFMMSEEIETPPESAGIPINKNNFAKQIAELKKEGTVKAYVEGPLQGLEFKVDEAKLGELESFVQGAVHAVAYQSDKIGEIISEESQAYFSGQKSAEAVAKLIQNKVTTILNE
ncbi:ABC transporter substrate-binding protein [Cohnella lupini]|uniref:Multiple sugar transport system substrate-binding protein n=1 Tax=Cohnella lupini TaxID=1294267 RepID=A0A3D9IC09_9BACL|nr:extracellular solute-binding protein [Cohnella lupini]RED59211.1 multiple sugar transport system substrate-binding protein [Cohnella lupini]